MRQLIFLALIVQSISLFAQVSEGGMPLSFKFRTQKSSIVLPEFKLHVIEPKKLLEKDEADGISNRYSEFEIVNINLKDGLNRVYNSENGQIWQYLIKSDSALTIQVMFSKFFIPPGAKLFIYNEDYTLIYGAFTEKNNLADSSFILADFASKHIIVEYFEPFDAPFGGQVIIGSIGQAYKDIINTTLDESSYIDINCPEGKDWQYEKHAVCKITFKIGLTGYLCTGSLINNVKQDGIPYFLTANHCIDNETSAKSVVAYFNYEREGCTGNIKSSKTLVGATLCTRGEDSDYSLLKLSSTPPADYKPFYAGWDARSNNPVNGTCIHHPQGIIKKITIDYDEITPFPYSISWDEGSPSPANTHWAVQFDDGAVAGGSSGSPIFNSYKRIFGQLHGGVDADEYYGMLSYSFTHSKAGYNSLKSFLDPNNSGIKYLDGYAPAGNSPDAFFACDFATVCPGASVQLSDYSSFTPTSWEWYFEPSTITYADGTNATSKNPVITFNQNGVYSVKLLISNGTGSDSVSMDNIVSVSNEIQIGLSKPTSSESCLCDFDSLLIQPNGATDYTWSFNTDATEFCSIYDSENGKVLKLKPGTESDSSIHINMVIIGIQGSCVDTLNYNYTLIKQINDSIGNAISLELGKNGPLTNRCATIEANEPVPLHTSCTGQKSWCDEYSNGQNIVENSVWYTFEGPASGIVGIRSEGFDNQMAVYQANSYFDILEGNYTILGANDDYTDTDWNPTIKSIKIDPSTTYWLQVDGSGGGLEGDFYLYLFNDTATSVQNTKATKELKIYPQPATDLLNINCYSLENMDAVQIEVYSMDGRIIMTDHLSVSNEQAVQLDISGLSKGIYFLNVNSQSQLITGKFIKQ